MLALYRETGSYSRTAEALNREGIPARSGKQWYATSVRLVVQRHGPDHPVRASGRKPRVPFVLARLLRCPTCETLLTGTRVRRGTTRYACSNYAAMPHPRSSVSEALILPWIVEEAAQFRPPAGWVDRGRDRAGARSSRPSAPTSRAWPWTRAWTAPSSTPASARSTRRSPPSRTAPRRCRWSNPRGDRLDLAARDDQRHPPGPLALGGARARHAPGEGPAAPAGGVLGMTTWPARRVGDRILCGRKVAGRHVCQGELATVERLIAGSDARVAQTVITLPTGYVEDPPGSHHWLLSTVRGAPARDGPVPPARESERLHGRSDRIRARRRARPARAARAVLDAGVPALRHDGYHCCGRPARVVSGNHRRRDHPEGSEHGPRDGPLPR